MTRRFHLAPLLTPIALGCTLLCSAALAATDPAPGAPSAIPIADFFRHGQFSQASLSPNGKKVAMLVADNNDRLVLAVMDSDGSNIKVLARYSTADIGEYEWVNDRRIVYSLTDRKLAVGDVDRGEGLFAIDIDGQNQRMLIEQQMTSEHHVARVLSPRHQLFSTLPYTESDDVYVTEYLSTGSKRRGTLNLLRLDTRTGKTTAISRPGDVESWLLDRTGAPRVVTTFESGQSVAYLREGEQWRKLFSEDSSSESGLRPAFFSPNGDFYVTALYKNDTRALYRYDLQKNQIEAEPLVAMDGYDFNGTPLFSKESNTLRGIHYDADAPGTLWLDPEYKALQAKIDARLPGLVNRLQIRRIDGHLIALVHSFSDTHPGETYLYNAGTDALQLLGQARPWIKPEHMAQADFVKYKARDGMTIPAYLTLPKGQNKNLPLVVLVHGGPYVRGEHWGWHPQAQFLASRGYAVLQPEFRGSMGYGMKHYKAGWKQWGLAMQDDVTDGTRWLIDQGIVDPKRVCIAGASYGGYATLWGLIKEHDLYQCGISWVGVSDISMLYSVSWSDANDDTYRYYLPQRVGDLEKDAAQLKATSPVEHASALTRPLILAYGGSDRRVPLVHGTRFMEAAKVNNQQIEWIEYPEEGHGWSKLKNNVDFWGRVEIFLNRYIGPAAAK